MSITPKLAAVESYKTEWLTRYEAILAFRNNDISGNSVRRTSQQLRQVAASWNLYKLQVLIVVSNFELSGRFLFKIRNRFMAQKTFNQL